MPNPRLRRALPAHPVHRVLEAVRQAMAALAAWEWAVQEARA